MTHAELLMNYLLKKNPDATIMDWKNALKDIEDDRATDTDKDSREAENGGVVRYKTDPYLDAWHSRLARYRQKRQAGIHRSEEKGQQAKSDAVLHAGKAAGA